MLILLVIYFHLTVFNERTRECFIVSETKRWTFAQNQAFTYSSVLHSHKVLMK